MTLPAPGWYADPTSPPGTRVRYWDGVAWTEHVQVQQPVPAGQPAAAPAYQYQQPQPGYPAYGVPLVPTTPDGARLAGWWSRVLAQVIDGFILAPVALAAMVPIIAGQWDEITAWFDAISAAADNGTSVPAAPDLFDPTSGAGLALLLVPMAVSLVYNIGFLRWKQATPGKLVVGLRVRLRETPGPLPWGAVLARVGFVAGLSLFSVIPFIGFLFTLASLLNYLWPLWDSRKQALHDKVAKTNVITVR